MDDEDYIKEIRTDLKQLANDFGEHISRDASEHFNWKSQQQDLELAVFGKPDKEIPGVLKDVKNLSQSFELLENEMAVVIKLKKWLIVTIGTLLTGGLLGLLKFIWDNIHITVGK